MKVGDLGKVVPHCLNRGRLAIVTGAYQFGSVRIVYVDGGPQPNITDGKGHPALVRNLELVSELP